MIQLLKVTVYDKKYEIDTKAEKTFNFGITGNKTIMKSLKYLKSKVLGTETKNLSYSTIYIKFCTNDILYDYHITTTTNMVTGETLRKIINGKPVVIFSRINDEFQLKTTLYLKQEKGDPDAIIVYNWFSKLILSDRFLKKKIISRINVEEETITLKLSLRKRLKNMYIKLREVFV